MVDTPLKKCAAQIGIVLIMASGVFAAAQQVIDDKAQYHSALELTRWLRCKFKLPVKDVIGHNESLSSPYYIEHVASWRGQTHEDFNRRDMNVVRAAVAKLPCTAPAG